MEVLGWDGGQIERRLTPLDCTRFGAQQLRREGCGIGSRDRVGDGIGNRDRQNIEDFAQSVDQDRNVDAAPR